MDAGRRTVATVAFLALLGACTSSRPRGIAPNVRRSRDATPVIDHIDVCHDGLEIAPGPGARPRLLTHLGERDHRHGPLSSASRRGDDLLPGRARPRGRGPCSRLHEPGRAGHAVRLTPYRGIHYRVVVLYGDFGAPASPSLVPVSFPSARRVFPDGTTRPDDQAGAQLSVLYAEGVAEVRINAGRGAGHGADEMRPVHGWVAFPAVTVSGRNAFDLYAEGFDANGKVIAQGLPYRCC